MANLFIQDTTLTAIADAIRAKSGSTATYTPFEMPAAILTINGGGGSSGGSGVIEHVSITGTMYDSLGYQYDLTPYMDRDFYFVNWIRTSSSVDPYFQHFIYHAADGTTESLDYGNDPLTTTKANAAKAKGSLVNGILTLDYYSSSYAVQKTCHLFVCNAGAGGGGITPEGELEITDNGDYDVTEYASAHVAVPVGLFPEGEVHITANGDYDVTGLASAIVRVPSGGSGSDNVADSLIQRSISGDYTNSTVYEIGSNAFYNCYNLKSISFPSVTRVYSQAFYICSQLQSVSLPKCMRLSGSTFASCGALNSVYLPALQITEGSDFNGCNNLRKVDLPALTNLGTRTFYNCSNLETLILRSQTKVTYNNGALYGTKIANGNGGYVYVPRALISDYVADSNWQVNGVQFRAIEDYPDICG